MTTYNTKCFKGVFIIRVEMALASKTELEKRSLIKIFWCLEHRQMCFFEDKVISFETLEGELLWPIYQTKAASFRTHLDHS